ncbi:MAG: PAS domain-containing sensor histidine kinase [Candidatus Fermentibacteraceae bacterium]
MTPSLLPSGAHPDQAGLEAACRGLVPSDALTAAVFTDSAGVPLYACPDLSPEELASGNWVYISARTFGSVGVLRAESPAISFAEPIIYGLGVICLALALTALLMPAYLRSRVIDPLRRLLVQADSYRSGSGNDPVTASVSFHELVELLARRERELENMRERAVARADLAESRAGAVLETLDSAVAGVDSSGALLLMNARAKELYGLTEEDRGKPFPYSRTPLGVASGTPGGEVEFDGRSFRVKTLTHSGGELIVTATDISEELLLERRLAEERALADLGAFSGGVVHEIGNTLCAVRGFLDLLSRGAPDERSKKLIDEARLELDSASCVVDAFRTLARGGEGPRFIPVPGEEIVSCVRQECINSGVSFRCACAFDGFYRTDTVLLARCVRNLLENALENCGKEEVTVTVEGPGPLTIQVLDTGPGLPDPPETVFRPLYSTGRDKGHMGIGLTVSRRIILAMGGRMTAKNTGTGASFVITLPGEDSR